MKTAGSTTIGKAVALLIALSLASATAATNAGTTIANQATASFSDASGTAQTPVYSNAVSTTVQAVPSFTVLLAGQNSTGTAGVNGAGLTPAGTQSLVPGSTASFKYTITNTGNVTGDTYSLVTPQPTYNATSGAAPGTPTYYATDAGGNCTTTVATTAGPLNPNGTATFCVVYTVPTTAANGDKLGTDAVVALTQNLQKLHLRTIRLARKISKPLKLHSFGTKNKIKSTT